MLDDINNLKQHQFQFLKQSNQFYQWNMLNRIANYIRPGKRANNEEANVSSSSSENDSDVESIPTLSHFKARKWANGHAKILVQSTLINNNWTRKEFGDNLFIEGEWRNKQLIILQSCEFSHPNSDKTVYIRKQGSRYLLLFDQENFIASAQIDNVEKWNFDEPPVNIKRNILKNLRKTEIIQDDLLSNRDKANELLKQVLQYESSKSADCLAYADDLFQFANRLDVSGMTNDIITILQPISKNQNVSQEIKCYIKQVIDRENALNIRKKELLYIPECYASTLPTGLRQICLKGIENHRNILHDIYLKFIFTMAPIDMRDHIYDLKDKLILYIGKKDLELFSDLVEMMTEYPFSDLLFDAWNDLFEKIIKRGKCIDINCSLKNFGPITCPIYFYLCKSFQELLLEFSQKTDIAVTTIIEKNKKGKWSLKKFGIEAFSSSLINSLESQFHIIFELMNHYQPGFYSHENKFKYKFKLDIFDEFQNNNECQERLVWLYIFDTAIDNLISAEDLELYKPLIEGYANYIRNTKKFHYESLRIVTHNIIRFITQTDPYLKKVTSDQTLIMQIESIKQALEDGQFDDFGVLVDVYNEYWKNGQTILEIIPDKFPYGKFREDMKNVYQTLIDITNTALHKRSKSEGFIKYFRSFNQFLEDLNEIEFNWFIKKNDIHNFTNVQVVNGDKKSYQVLNIEDFINECEDIPKHYIIEIIQDLLNTVRSLLLNKKINEFHSLIMASKLLTAIRKSFLYLKEQANYLSYKNFYNESTQPFASTVMKCNSYEDFIKRIEIVGESFWYLRTQDEIDIDKALQLYRNQNDSTNVDVLKNCYETYLKQFQFYLDETVNESFEDKNKYITEAVKKQTKIIKFNKWTSNFKREILPELLAGLAAVWSINESKDIARTGKYLKPHCIQILCIFRLLSVDNNSEGVDKHLAQVLTGQGKSLVLGMLSSILALTGHAVRTVCYSEYLATRDQKDFEKFFDNFGIRDKIIYGTFEEMANEILNPKVNGKKQSLRHLVEHRINNHNADLIEKVELRNLNDAVLLIDEVDVFFSQEFYGNSYGAGTNIVIPGIAEIQEKIWEMASKSYEKRTISKELDEFINKNIQERNQEFIEFNKFRVKSGKYFLLKNENHVIINKLYTNQSLCDEHLEEMIDTAITVKNGSNQNWYINKFKINDTGIICCKHTDGIYSPHHHYRYYNAFNYFRLKKKDFNTIFYKNYGKFQINCGQVSYAQLPNKYPLILGVSGTLSTLDYYEKKTIKESYNIHELSVMPSFFGQSHLEFDSIRDFVSRNTEEEWLREIFDHANSKINSGQSVLIFFDTDTEINKFKEKYLGKFDRLQILTQNTESASKEKYIDEAGIIKTITLATKEMGRGVDFKSSVAVEKNGGMHVIQTFFSLDIKEEIQIKGRTARKDNKGSYELILCNKNLVKENFLKKSDTIVSYYDLHNSRQEIYKSKRSEDDERIKKSESNHNTTMDYFASFFKLVDDQQVSESTSETGKNGNGNRLSQLS